MSYSYSRKEGDRIRFRIGTVVEIATGTIRGVAASELPVIGNQWIVELDKKLDSWPFTCVTCFEVNIIENL